MLQMVDKETRGGICHSIHRHAKANNKYIKNYDKKKKNRHISYIQIILVIIVIILYVQ